MVYGYGEFGTFVNSKDIDGDPLVPLAPIVNIPPNSWAQLRSSEFTEWLPIAWRSFANGFIEWICNNGRRLADTPNASSFYDQNDDLVLRIRLAHPETQEIRAWQFTFELLDERGGEYYGLEKVELLMLAD